MSNFFLTSAQCFFLGIIAGALVGFIQGWPRAVILMAFTLAGVLFLSLGGGQGLANIIFVRFPVVWQTVLPRFRPCYYATRPNRKSSISYIFDHFPGYCSLGLFHWIPSI